MLLKPTMNYGSTCEETEIPPFIGDCKYDIAYETLQHIYGSLKVLCCNAWHKSLPIFLKLRAIMK